MGFIIRILTHIIITILAIASANSNQLEHENFISFRASDIDKNAPEIKKSILRMCVFPEKCEEEKEEEKKPTNDFLPLICDTCERLKKIKSNKKKEKEYRKSIVITNDEVSEYDNNVNEILDDFIEQLKSLAYKSSLNNNDVLLRYYKDPNEGNELLEELVKIVLNSKSNCDCSAQRNGLIDILTENRDSLRCACINTGSHDKFNTEDTETKIAHRSLIPEALRDESLRGRSLDEEMSQQTDLNGLNQENLVSINQREKQTNDDSLEDDDENINRSELYNILRCGGAPLYTSCPIVTKYTIKKKKRKGTVFAKKGEKRLRQGTVDSENIASLLQKLLISKENVATRCGCGKTIEEDSDEYKQSENMVKQAFRSCRGVPGFTSCPLVAKYYNKKKKRKSLRERALYTISKFLNKDPSEPDSSAVHGDDLNDMELRNIVRCGGPPLYTSCPLVAKYYKKKRKFKRGTVFAKKGDKKRLRHGNKNSVTTSTLIDKLLTSKEDVADERDSDEKRRLGHRDEDSDSEAALIEQLLKLKDHVSKRCGCNKEIEEDSDENKKSKNMVKQAFRSCGGLPGFTSCPLVAKYYKKKKKIKSLRERALHTIAKNFKKDTVEADFIGEKRRLRLSSTKGDEDSEHMETILEQLLKSKMYFASRCGCGRGLEDFKDLTLAAERCGCGGKKSLYNLLGLSNPSRCGCSKGLADEEELELVAERCGCGGKQSLQDLLGLSDGTRCGNYKGLDNEEYFTREAERCGCGGKKYLQELLRLNDGTRCGCSKGLDDAEDLTSEPERCGCGGKKSLLTVLGLNDPSRCGCNKGLENAEELEQVAGRCGCGGKQFSKDQLGLSDATRCGCSKGTKTLSELLGLSGLSRCGCGKGLEDADQAIGRCGCGGNKSLKDRLGLNDAARCGCSKGLDDEEHLATEGERCGSKGKKTLSELLELSGPSRCGCGKGLEDADQSIGRCGCGGNKSLKERLGLNDATRCGCSKGLDDEEDLATEAERCASKGKKTLSELLELSGPSRCGCGKGLEDADQAIGRCGCGRNKSLKERLGFNDATRCGCSKGLDDEEDLTTEAERCGSRGKKTLSELLGLSGPSRCGCRKGLEDADQAIGRCGCGGNKSLKEQLGLNYATRCGCSKGIADEEDLTTEAERCGSRGKRTLSELLGVSGPSRCGCGKGLEDAEQAIGRCGCGGNKSLKERLDLNDATRCGCSKGLEDTLEILKLTRPARCGCSKGTADSMVLENPLRCGKKKKSGGKRCSKQIENSEDILSDILLRCGCSRSLQDEDTLNYLRCGCRGKKGLTNQDKETYLQDSSNVINNLVPLLRRENKCNEIYDRMKKSSTSRGISTTSGRYVYSRCGCTQHREEADVSSETEDESDSSGESSLTIAIEDNTLKNNTNGNPNDKTLRLTTQMTHPDKLYFYLKYLTHHGKKYKVNDDIDAFIVDVPELTANLSENIQLRTELVGDKDKSPGMSAPTGYRWRKKIKKMERPTEPKPKSSNDNVDWLRNPLIKKSATFRNTPNNVNSIFIKVVNPNDDLLTANINQNSRYRSPKEDSEALKIARDYLINSFANHKDINMNSHTTGDEAANNWWINNGVQNENYKQETTYKDAIGNELLKRYIESYKNDIKRDYNNLSRHKILEIKGLINQLMQDYKKRSNDNDYKLSKNTNAENLFERKHIDEHGQNHIKNSILALGFDLDRKVKKSIYKKDRNFDSSSEDYDHLENSGKGKTYNHRVQVPKNPHDLPYINELQTDKKYLLQSKHRQQLHENKYYTEKSRHKDTDGGINIHNVNQLLNKLNYKSNPSNFHAVLINAHNFKGHNYYHDTSSEPVRKTDVEGTNDEKNSKETLNGKEIIKEALINDVLDYVKHKRAKIPLFLNKKQRSFVKKLTNTKDKKDYKISEQELEKQIEDLLFGEALEKKRKLKLKRLKNRKRKLHLQNNQNAKEQAEESEGLEDGFIPLKLTEPQATRSIVSPKEQLKKRNTLAVLQMNAESPKKQQRKQQMWYWRRNEASTSYGVPFEMDLNLLAQVN